MHHSTEPVAQPANEIWYRYEDVAYAAPAWGDEISPFTSSVLRVELRRFRVVRRTPKGVWLEPYFDAHSRIPYHTWTNSRFVLLTARKQFACATIEAARASFVVRKRRQISIHEAHARRAREALRAMEQRDQDLAA